MSNHTPGPWKIPGTDGGEYVICHKDNSGKQRTVSHVYYEANARLIAAAPDLLEALQFLLADWIAINGDRITGSRVPAEKAIAAIAKAKGKK